MDSLNKGVNTFEMTCGDNGEGYGMFGFYGATFRIYYETSKPHAKGHVVLPDTGSQRGSLVKLKLELEDLEDEIKRVDYIGYYEDYDYDGDGLYLDWQYIMRNCIIDNHIGALDKPFSPYLLFWDTKWIPDQKQPIKIMARIKSKDNVYYMTPVNDDLILDRDSVSVKIFRPYDVPENFQTAGSQIVSNKVDVKLESDGTSMAQLIMSTWNGQSSDYMKINENILSTNMGSHKDQSFSSIPIPIEFLEDGENNLYMFSSDEENGTEILWPGMAVKVRTIKD